MSDSTEMEIDEDNNITDHILEQLESNFCEKLGYSDDDGLKSRYKSRSLNEDIVSDLKKCDFTEIKAIVLDSFLLLTTKALIRFCLENNLECEIKLYQKDRDEHRKQLKILEYLDLNKHPLINVSLVNLDLSRYYFRKKKLDYNVLILDWAKCTTISLRGFSNVLDDITKEKIYVALCICRKRSPDDSIYSRLVKRIYNKSELNYESDPDGRVIKEYLKDKYSNVEVSHCFGDTYHKSRGLIWPRFVLSIDK